MNRVERGERLSSDTWLELVPPPSPRAAAVVAFPGHVVVAAAVELAWVRSWMTDGDLSAPLNPLFLGALEERLRFTVDNVDTVMLAPPCAGDPPLALTPLALTPLALTPLALTPLGAVDHPRVARALRHRRQVRVWVADGGIVLIGRGLVGRWEVAVEVDPGHRNNGLGRALALSARHLVPDRRPLWAQVAPGNAASVRAFLAAGYQPIGAEALLTPWDA